MERQDGQDYERAKLYNIDPVAGQAAMADSLPVVIASDQSDLPITLDSEFQSLAQNKRRKQSRYRQFSGANCFRMVCPLESLVKQQRHSSRGQQLGDFQGIQGIVQYGIPEIVYQPEGLFINIFSPDIPMDQNYQEEDNSYVSLSREAVS